MGEAEIDESLAESFPASDPPSWTLGSSHAPTEQTPGGDGPSGGSGPDKETQ